ncbi:putative phage tail protein [Acetobacter cibinongensis]|uniref:DUF2313 domain-containing protein n=1 Tax=Acetobacter cibinongensis TaxID=146475 RepID=A0A1Z5YR79_9PROT|nr:putative phage tail protein [Acetobacter cibinongensis]OUI98334.1 hypothetical protein HK14_15645 [Acetobacter cibinongensis]
MIRTPQKIRDEWLHDLMPPGAIERSEDGNLAKLLLGFAGPFSTLEGDIDGLALEISPGTATGLLADYEAVLGPDPCGRDKGGLSVAQRQALALQRWVAASGVTPDFFKNMAAAAGFTITIEETDTPIYGRVRMGAARYGTSEMRFVWIVTLPSTTTGLECPMRRLCPAQATLVFKYADAA